MGCNRDSIGTSRRHPPDEREGNLPTYLGRPDRVHNAPRSCELGHPPSSAVATSLLVGGIDAKIPFLQPINLGCSRSVSTTFRHHLKGVGPAGGLCQSLIVSDG